MTNPMSKFKVIELPAGNLELLNEALSNLDENLHLIQLVPTQKFLGTRLMDGSPKIESYMVGVFEVLDA